VQIIQPTLEEIQAAASKAGLMMIDVNRRISQWDQQRIMSSVESGGGKTQIVSGRPSRLPRATAVFEEEGPRASTVPGAVGAEPGKAPGATAADAATLSVPDQGQSRRRQHQFFCSGCGWFQ